MIDFHAHILSETDDGATNFSESVAILFEAKKAGFTGIVCTPHYMQGFYEKDKAYIKERINELKIDCKRLGMHLYQGNEVYAAQEIVQFLKDEKISTINDSRFLLIEFPLTDEPMMNSLEIIDEIVKAGYIPIVAHPERYPYVQKDIKFVKDLLERGAYIQANYSSIDGYYGIKAKKAMIKLLKNKLIQFLGSDTHRKRTIYLNTEKYIAEILKYLTEDELDELSYKNPIRVINDENVKRL